MRRRIIVGICGASGVIYGVRCLELLRDAGCETHLVISPGGRLNIEIETPFSVEQVEAMADFAYDYEDVSAPIASGSFLTQGMIVAPCTIKSLSAIANSYSDNLLVRAADVVLKERRKLCLLVRETPLHKGHLRLMGMAADLGALILPPMPAFYHLPKTIEEIIDHTVGKVFDYFDIEHALFKRWNGDQRGGDRQ